MNPVAGAAGRRVSQQPVVQSIAIEEDRRHPSRTPTRMISEILESLQQRLGLLYPRQRIALEDDFEARALDRNLNYFNPGSWFESPTIIGNALKLAGLHWRAKKNAERVQIRHNDIMLPRLPSSFDGFTILHMSDLHVDMNEGTMQRLIELLPGLSYDLCVLTGDYRGKGFGPFDATIEGLARVCARITGTMFGVLGNYGHDPHGTRVGGDRHPHAAQ
jgi:uncharacterized protein